MFQGPRDHTLIDALEVLTAQGFEGRLWRVARDGRDPTLFFSGGNRWDSGAFDVLYTSLIKEGALAEMHYHSTRGQPIAPSKIRYRLHELEARINGVLDLTSRSFLSRLKVNMAAFGKLPYLKRQAEYEICQRIGEAVHFLGSKSAEDPSAILVPNARYECTNMVIFGDHVNPGDIEHVRDHGVIDWSKVELGPEL